MGPPPASTVLITGASGLLGTHLVDRLIARGRSILAVVRPTSEVGPLERPGVRIARGDLTDPAFVDAQVAQAGIVIHCAAKLSNWGPAVEFEQGNVVPAEHLTAACQRHPVERLVHISSIAVYGHPGSKAGLIDETAPIGTNLLSFDRYNWSKIAAERIVQRLGDRVTILRPTWSLGRGDRYIVPAVVRKLRKGAVWLLGSGDNRLNGLAVEDVAEGVIAAATEQAAGGEVFNLASAGELTQREFVHQVCDRISLPRVRRRVPIAVVRRYAWCVEMTARLTQQSSPPFSDSPRPDRLHSANAIQHREGEATAGVAATGSAGGVVGQNTRMAPVVLTGCRPADRVGLAPSQILAVQFRVPIHSSALS